jgi:hypothetical protein
MPTVVMCVHVFPGKQGGQLIRGELRIRWVIFEHLSPSRPHNDRSWAIRAVNSPPEPGVHIGGSASVLHDLPHHSA